MTREDYRQRGGDWKASLEHWRMVRNKGLEKLQLPVGWGWGGNLEEEEGTPQKIISELTRAWAYLQLQTDQVYRCTATVMTQNDNKVTTKNVCSILKS